jgi:biofilm PGA synthesis N-glycosyltransferase PgaC
VILAYTFISIVAFYGIILLIVAHLWNSIPIVETEESKQREMGTVIIPLRNEAHNMERLLKEVSHLTKDNVEVILVNDHSSDDTTAWLDKISPDLFISALSLKKTHGKKAAIMKGIENARGEIILTSDADCSLDPKWADHMLCALDESTSFVYGPVKYRADDSLFSQMQQMELVILQVFSGATWASGFPTMCNGANLAYRKDDFMEGRGFDDNVHIASGDDEFTMHGMLANKKKIRYVKPSKPEVTTNTENRFGSFLNQRQRWSGKWKNYSHQPSKMLAVFVLIFNLIFALSPVVYFAGLITGKVFLWIFLAKMISEWILLRRVKRYFDLQMKTLPFLLLTIIYPYYVLVFGFVSHVGTFSWKDREYANG